MDPSADTVSHFWRNEKKKLHRKEVFPIIWGMAGRLCAIVTKVAVCVALGQQSLPRLLNRLCLQCGDLVSGALNSTFFCEFRINAALQPSLDPDDLLGMTKGDLLGNPSPKDTG